MNPAISATLILGVSAILVGLSNAHAHHRGHSSSDRAGKSYPGSKCGPDVPDPDDSCDVDKTNLECQGRKNSCACEGGFHWWNDIKKCRGGVKAGENCTAATGAKTYNKLDDVCVHSKMVCSGGQCQCPSGDKCEGGPPKWDPHPPDNGSPPPCNIITGPQYWFVLLTLVEMSGSGCLAVDWQ